MEEIGFISEYRHAAYERFLIASRSFPLCLPHCKIQTVLQKVEEVVEPWQNLIGSNTFFFRRQGWMSQVEQECLAEEWKTESAPTRTCVFISCLTKSTWRGQTRALHWKGVQRRDQKWSAGDCTMPTMLNVFLLRYFLSTQDNSLRNSFESDLFGELETGIVEMITRIKAENHTSRKYFQHIWRREATTENPKETVQKNHERMNPLSRRNNRTSFFPEPHQTGEVKRGEARALFSSWVSKRKSPQFMSGKHLNFGRW
jgi:hypothetical protein